MDLDHPPVDVLRLASRAAALCGLVAGAVRLTLSGLTLDLGPATFLWGFLIAGLVAAVGVVLLVPRFEFEAGVALVVGAVLATLLGGGFEMTSLLGWTYGFAMLFFGSGLFALSAWGWSRRDAPHHASPRPVEEPDVERA